jgi:Na+-translocating ferredoxin:NAD+ oxidoreductase RnfD subunit
MSESVAPSRADATVHDRRFPFVGPDLRDPRLHVALVVVGLQVLGQTLLRFDISVAQILVALATCAVIDVAITLCRQRVIAWPTSALLTGNGVAFVLRVPGTRYGDWWSLRGGWIFAAVAAVSVLSKYLIRVDGRPLFNPSNFGLVLCFLVLGSRRVDPLDFWWVRPGIALAIALSVIIVGGVWLTWRVRSLDLIASFGLTFAAAVGVLAVRGHCITTRWHIGPVCDGSFWMTLATSPEVLVFVFFMITDPKTVPRGRMARKVYGAAIALVFVALAAPQRTEFATKVALLGALALVCAARPLLERLLPAAGPQPDRLGTVVGFGRTGHNRADRRPSTVGSRLRFVAVVTVAAVTYTAIIVGAGTPAATWTVRPVVAAVPAHCENTAASGSRTRPQVQAEPLPAVTVRDAINVATPISVGVAMQIVRDVIDDLAIATDAIVHRDATLAWSVARYPWLDDLISTICTGTGRQVVATYHFTTATVTVAKRATGQVFPEIDVALQGDRHETTITRSTPRRQLAERVGDYRNTFVVTKVAGDWLICGNRSDPRTAACVTVT